MILKTPPDFRFVPSVCSHGFFVLAPNRWEPAARALHTTLNTPGGRSWAVVIDAPKNGTVRVRVPGGRPSRSDLNQLRRQVTRILRLDEDLSEFHRFCRARPSHAHAAKVRFGRLLRSPTLFEDVIKVMCTCNITWKQTVSIVAEMVRLYGEPADNDPQRRAFPGAERLARVSDSDLRGKCRLGYRAPWVLELARRVSDGSFDLTDRRAARLGSPELYKELRDIKGVGDYAAGHLLMLLGRYNRLAIDTELLRHFKKHYPRRKPTEANIRKHYDACQPFAFLAYWYELWSDYVAEQGDPSTWGGEQGAEITRKS